MPEVPPGTLEQLRRNADVFDELVEVGVAAWGAGSASTAASIAQLAASVGWRHHGGVFVSPTLEDLLRELGDRSVPDEPRAARPPGHRVLHVLTKAFAIGGHARLAWRTIRRDGARTHDLALLDQREARPRALVESVRRRGGRVWDLTGDRGDLLRQADGLRRLARDYDAVLLYTHPDDVVPPMAFGTTRRPPIGFVNHAGQRFSLGVGVADSVGWLHEGKRLLCVERRGIEAERLHRFPLALGDTPAPLQERGRAIWRKHLGLRADATVAVVVGEAHRFRTADGLHLALVLERMLSKRPDLQIAVIGPKHDREWADAHERRPAQVEVVAKRPILPYLSVADLFIDSYPLSSETAVREAALLGLPVLSFTRERAAAPSTVVDLAGDADDLVVRAPDEATFDEQLAVLIDDETFRSRRGAALRDAVTAQGTGPQFRGAIEDFHAHLHDSSPAVGGWPRPERRFDAIDGILCAADGTPPGLDLVAEAERIKRRDSWDKPRARLALRYAEGTLGSLRARVLHDDFTW